MGVSQATFFNWKKKYGGISVTELRKLRQIEEENALLKKLVADLSLDRQMLQDMIKKSCEACLQKGNGLLDGQQLSGIYSAGVSMCMPFQVDVLLYPLPTSTG